MRNKGVRAAKETRLAKVQRGNKSTIIRSLTDEEGIELLESKVICAAFQQHYSRLFGTTSVR